MATKFLSSDGSLSVRSLANKLGLKATLDQLEDVGEFFADEWRKTLDQPGSGRVYRRELRTVMDETGGFRVVPFRFRDEPHRASAPGEPPAPDTRDLQDSISVERTQRTVRVGSDDPAAVFMEFGVTNHPAGITIAPRPHARPTFDRIRDQLTRVLVPTIRKVQNRDAKGRFAKGFRTVG